MIGRKKTDLLTEIVKAFAHQTAAIDGLTQATHALFSEVASLRMEVAELKSEVEKRRTINLRLASGQGVRTNA